MIKQNFIMLLTLAANSFFYHGLFLENEAPTWKTYLIIGKIGPSLLRMMINTFVSNRMPSTFLKKRFRRKSKESFRIKNSKHDEQIPPLLILIIKAPKINSGSELRYKLDDSPIVRFQN